MKKLIVSKSNLNRISQRRFDDILDKNMSRNKISKLLSDGTNEMVLTLINDHTVNALVVNIKTGKKICEWSGSKKVGGFFMMVPFFVLTAGYAATKIRKQLIMAAVGTGVATVVHQDGYMRGVDDMAAVSKEVVEDMVGTLPSVVYELAKNVIDGNGNLPMLPPATTLGDVGTQVVLSNSSSQYDIVQGIRDIGSLALQNIEERAGDLKATNAPIADFFAKGNYLESAQELGESVVRNLRNTVLGMVMWTLKMIGISNNAVYIATYIVSIMVVVIVMWYMWVKIYHTYRTTVSAFRGLYSMVVSDNTSRVVNNTFEHIIAYPELVEKIQDDMSKSSKTSKSKSKSKSFKSSKSKSSKSVDSSIRDVLDVIDKSVKSKMSDADIADVVEKDSESQTTRSIASSIRSTESSMRSYASALSSTSRTSNRSFKSVSDMKSNSSRSRTSNNSISSMKSMKSTK